MSGMPTTAPAWEQPRPGATATVRVPASSANLGPGFDSIGIALGLWDECTVTVTDTPGVVVEVTGEGAGVVPTDESHLVVRSLARTFAHVGLDVPAGLHLRCTNAVPHSRGLGSSATAIVTGATAAVALACPGATPDVARADPALHEELLDVVNQVASVMEGHPDNASASVYGGATVSVLCSVYAEVPDEAPLEPQIGIARTSGEQRTETTRLPLHPDLEVVVCVPSTRLSTALARSVLPETVPLAVAAQSVARGALLVHALTSDPERLLAGTVDLLHQEQRRPSYPDAMALVDELRAQGHAAVISGAGPSVLVLTTSKDLDAARAAVGSSSGWDVLAPGVPGEGCTVVAVVH